MGCTESKDVPQHGAAAPCTPPSAAATAAAATPYSEKSLAKAQLRIARRNSASSSSAHRPSPSDAPESATETSSFSGPQTQGLTLTPLSSSSSSSLIERSFTARDDGQPWPPTVSTEEALSSLDYAWACLDDGRYAAAHNAFVENSRHYALYVRYGAALGLSLVAALGDVYKSPRRMRGLTLEDEAARQRLLDFLTDCLDVSPMCMYATALLRDSPHLRARAAASHPLARYLELTDRLADAEAAADAAAAADSVKRLRDLARTCECAVGGNAARRVWEYYYKGTYVKKSLYIAETLLRKALKVETSTEKARMYWTTIHKIGGALRMREEQDAQGQGQGRRSSRGGIFSDLVLM